jgi:L-alanine-DL-glutamate epimerase-like enolase superfamily enzyme
VKITAIETLPISVGVDRRVGPVQNAKGFRFTSHLVVIFIRTDTGIEGLGEVNGSADWSGETQVGAQALISQHLAPRLIGEDPRRIRHCMDRLKSVFANSFAKAGIEMALFDILGKSLQTPLYQLLGGATRAFDLPLRFPIMPVGPQESAAAATRMVSEGFQTIKLKVGHDPLEFDLERVRLVREAIGSQVRLTVDANGGWSVNDAIRASFRLEDYGVAFIEQPVHRLDLDGLARVRQQTRLPVMADEAVFTPQDALNCIRKEAADIISVCPGKHGGLLNTMAIVSMCEAAGVQCAIGSNLEWDIASAAMAHLTVVSPNISVERYAADIIGPLFHVTHALTHPWTVNHGQISVPQGPGLGIELDQAELAAMRTTNSSD